jgi:hypothetical protein
MIGNDVVDLLDAESRPESFRPRFDARVYSDSERAAIEQDARPLARRWAHWAAKEAAYKLARQVDPGFVFAPGRWAVHFDPARPNGEGRFERFGWIDLGERASHEGADELAGPAVALRSIETADWVHVLALPRSANRPQPADWRALRFGLAALEAFPDAVGGLASRQGALDASRAVRALAIAGLADFLEVEPERLSIGRVRTNAGDGGSSPGASRIPRVRLDGREIDLAISLSHHGRWIGYAMSPRIEWAIRDGWADSHGLGATA